MLTTSGTYPWSFVTQIFHSGQPRHGGDRNIFEVMTSTSKEEYRINREIYIPYAGAARIFLLIDGKFTMGKLKSSLLA